MSTNFYLRKKMPKEHKERIIKAIEKNLFNFALNLIHEYDAIHIGKRSCGWQFLWNANNFEYFEPNIESLTEFLKSGQIEDEYGNLYTYEEFIDEEIDECLTEGINIKKYYENNPNIYRHYANKAKKEIFKREFGIECNEYGEFEIDKYRFTIDTEWS